MDQTSNGGVNPVNTPTGTSLMENMGVQHENLLSDSEVKHMQKQYEIDQKIEKTVDDIKNSSVNSEVNREDTGKQDTKIVKGSDNQPAPNLGVVDSQDELVKLRTEHEKQLSVVNKRLDDKDSYISQLESRLKSKSDELTLLSAKVSNFEEYFKHELPTDISDENLLRSGRELLKSYNVSRNAVLSFSETKDRISNKNRVENMSMEVGFSNQKEADFLNRIIEKEGWGSKIKSWDDQTLRYNLNTVLANYKSVGQNQQQASVVENKEQQGQSELLKEIVQTQNMLAEHIKNIGNTQANGGNNIERVDYTPSPSINNQVVNHDKPMWDMDGNRLP